MIVKNRTMFARIKRWYDFGIWDRSRVETAVKKGTITPNQYEKITGVIYKPVNVCGITTYYDNGIADSIHDGYGYRDDNGNITWYDGYNPPEDNENHSTIVIPYGNGTNLLDMV